MIRIQNKVSENARILHDFSDLLNAPVGSLWCEQEMLINNSTNKSSAYVIATKNRDKEMSYIIVHVDEERNINILLPIEYKIQFPLVEVSDGTEIIFSNPKYE